MQVIEPEGGILHVTKTIWLPFHCVDFVIDPLCWSVGDFVWEKTQEPLNTFDERDTEREQNK